MALGLASACRRSQNSQPPAQRAAELKAADAQPKPPQDPALTSPHRGVWSSAPNNVWVVGSDGYIVHFDGKAWKRVPSGTSEGLKAIGGSAPDDLWVVGDHGTVLHYDGHAFTQLASNEDETLLDVRSTGRRGEVWLVGVTPQSALLKHYRDVSLGETRDIEDAASLWRLAVVTPQSIWAVGTDRRSKGFVLRGDGQQFERVPFEGGSLRAVFGTSPDAVWVAAYDGGLHRWDGQRWASLPVVQDTHWLGMWGAGPRDIWVVGLDGRAFRWNGDGWARINMPTREVLWAVAGSAQDDVWFVGGSGTRLRWDGKSVSASR